LRCVEILKDHKVKEDAEFESLAPRPVFGIPPIPVSQPKKPNRLDKLCLEEIRTSVQNFETLFGDLRITDPNLFIRFA
jgi:hypothetical protein